MNARFKTEGEQTLVQMMGSFRVLDDTPGKGPAQVLPISAEFPVQIDAQR